MRSERRWLDGLRRLRDVAFDVAIDASSWIAVRILPSSHTNPVFAIVGERADARAAHDHAREVYKRLVAESPVP